MKNFISTFRALLRSTKSEQGLSLIEVALGLMLVGFLILPTLEVKQYDIDMQNMEGTRGSLTAIQGGINMHYISAGGAYPCPASLILAEGKKKYGESGDCSVLKNISLCSGAWKSIAGICKTDNTPDAVIIGAVPFATIKMNQDDSFDRWGNKIIYAVSYKDTNKATFESGTGTVQVQTTDPLDSTSVVADLGTYDFILFSTGRNGVGGYSKDGKALQTCGDATTGYESENCDFDNLFFRESRNSFSKAVGPFYFDDYTLAQSSIPEETWFQHPDNAIYSENDFVLTLATRIGIGTSNPQQTVDVVGNVRAESYLDGANVKGGNIKTNAICNDTGVYCFDPQYITASKSSMRCADTGIAGVSQVVTSIGNSKVYCNATKDLGGGANDGRVLKVSNKIKRITCADGQVATGIKANGELECVDY